MSKERFLELAKETEALVDQLKSKNEEMNRLMLELGINTYIQDPETLTVYKIIKPIGRWVDFKEIDYKRTALEGERGGQPLSKKEAEEQGFILKK